MHLFGRRRIVGRSLPAKTKLREISKLEIATSFEGGLGGDNWDIADVELLATVP
jgi:hypothetical protein